MQQKTVPPINFLFYLTETRVDQLNSFLEQDIASQLQRSALDNGMRIIGPVYWNYFGFTGDESQPFQLEIAIPVDQLKTDYTGPFGQRRSEPFSCVSTAHLGGWPKIPETYGKLFQYIAQNGLKTNGMGREVYIHADFATPESSVTEIQIGLD